MASPAMGRKRRAAEAAMGAAGSDIATAGAGEPGGGALPATRQRTGTAMAAPAREGLSPAAGRLTAGSAAATAAAAVRNGGMHFAQSGRAVAPGTAASSGSGSGTNAAGARGGGGVHRRQLSPQRQEQQLSQRQADQQQQQQPAASGTGGASPQPAPGAAAAPQPAAEPSAQAGVASGSPAAAAPLPPPQQRPRPTHILAQTQVSWPCVQREMHFIQQRPSHAALVHQG